MRRIWWCEPHVWHALSSYQIWSAAEKLAEVMLSQALEGGDTDTAEESKQFFKMCELQWT